MKYHDTELAAGGLQQANLLYTTTVLKASLHEGYLPTLIISHESLSITQQSYIISNAQRYHHLPECKTTLIEDNPPK